MATHWIPPQNFLEFNALPDAYTLLRDAIRPGVAWGTEVDDLRNEVYARLARTTRSKGGDDDELDPIERLHRAYVERADGTRESWETMLKSRLRNLARDVRDRVAIHELGSSPREFLPIDPCGNYDEHARGKSPENEPQFQAPPHQIKEFDTDTHMFWLTVAAERPHLYMNPECFTAETRKELARLYEKHWAQTKTLGKAYKATMEKVTSIPRELPELEDIYKPQFRMQLAGRFRQMGLPLPEVAMDYFKRYADEHREFFLDEVVGDLLGRYPARFPLEFVNIAFAQVANAMYESVMVLDAVYVPVFFLAHYPFSLDAESPTTDEIIREQMYCISRVKSYFRQKFSKKNS